MNTVKKISITLIRLLLVVLAPEFAFSQSVQRKLPDRTATNACSSNIQLKQVGKERRSNKLKILMNASVVTYRGTVYPW